MGSFRSPFVNKANALRGKIAKDQGAGFEARLEFVCHRSGVLATRIPDGCKMIRTKLGAIIPKRVPTPFDFLLTKAGYTACIDCKTVESGNFSYSMLNEFQVRSLIGIYRSSISAGYIVWFRAPDKVIFFRASQLAALEPRESLKHEEGIMLGSSNDFSLYPVLELFRVLS